MRFLLFIATYNFCLSSFAQVSLIEKNAERLYESYAYIESIEKFKILYQKDESNRKYVERIADSYMKLNDSENSEVWLETLIKNHQNYLPEYIYFYAETLLENKKPREALSWYEKYKQFGGKYDVTGKIESVKNISEFYRKQDSYKVSRIPVNTKSSEFSPMYYKDGIAFLSSRKERSWVTNLYNWDQSDFLDFYYYQPAEDSVTAIQIETIKTKYHEGPGSVYDNGRKLVFTRNNTSKSKLKRNGEGVAKLQIYFSEISENGQWTEVTSFEHNDTEYSFGHPTISENGDFMIFVSDKPGGFGGTDLYATKLLNDNSWSVPINLGAKINTAGNEMFPFHQNGLLWFSTDGKPGLGGLDIFRVDISNGFLDVEPANPGAPLNSNKDDFGLISRDGFNGYFSSNRKGDDDLYFFSRNTVLANGKVLNQISNKPVADAFVSIFDLKGELVKKVLTNDSGVFVTELELNRKFTIEADKDHFTLVSPVQTPSLFPTDILEIKAIYLRPSTIRIEPVDEKTGEVLADGIITVKKADSEVLIESVGNNEYIIEPETTYEIIADKKGYYRKREERADLLSSANFTFKIALKEIVIGESIRLENIYYDVNSSNLRDESEKELDKLVEFMKDNAAIKIELSSHTDSRGSGSYNQNLSQRRAESAAEYIIANGISASRIVPVGYGENKLLNKCKNGVKCSSEEHQLNRRTEIKILKSSQ